MPFIHGNRDIARIASLEIALSLSAIVESYTGDFIEVRRSSDNALQNIGRKGFVLDEKALTDFVGANDGFVRTWYDQSGNNNDFQQTVNANQPRIVSSGTVEKKNGKPCIKFNFGGSNHYLDAGSSLFSGQSDYTVVAVAASDLADGNQTVSSIIAQDAGSGRIVSFLAMDDFNGIGGYGHFADATTTQLINFDSTVLNTNQHFMMAVRTSSTGGSFYLDNGSENTATGDPAWNNGTSNTLIGNIDGTTVNNFEGVVQEILGYTSDRRTDLVAIRTNINNYYSIF